MCSITYKLSVAVVQAGHGVKLSCHWQQSADKSTDHLLPIQLAKLGVGVLFKLLQPRLFCCFLCKPLCKPPPPQLLLLCWICLNQCHCVVTHACSVLCPGGFLLPSEQNRATPPNLSCCRHTYSFLGKRK